MGDLIPGGGGVRKLRWKADGKGKRGGVRVIYYWRNRAGEIWLLTIYAKNETGNMAAGVLRRLSYQGRTGTACHRSDSGRRESDSRQDGPVPIGFCWHFGCQCAHGPGVGAGAAKAFRSGGLPAAYCPKASRSIAGLTGQLKRIAWIGNRDPTRPDTFTGFPGNTSEGTSH